MSRLYKTLLRPVLTEKSSRFDDLNKVVFRVRKDATKHQVREAVETLFGVKVDKVNTMIVAGKPKRAGRNFFKRSGYKKAVITLAEGESIDFFAMEDGEAEGDTDEN